MIEILNGRRLPLLLRASAALGLACAAGPIHSQTYPDKPVRMIVAYAAGGNADILARIISQKLGEALGQQFVVDNRGGANGVIGTELVAKAVPDGYTLLFVANGHAINPGMYAKLPFDPIKDFSPISLVASTPLIITVTAALPANTIKGLVALAKSRPGDLSYASQGNGSAGHLAGALFNSLNGVNIVHVPYKSTAQGTTDLISGQVQVMFPSATSVLPHIRSGKLRGIAITSRQRSTLAPELPTAMQSGMPSYDVGIWNGVLAPAGTLQAIVDRLNAALVKIIQTSDTHARILGTGADPMTSTPAEFGAFISAEIRKWGKVIKDSGAKLD